MTCVSWKSKVFPFATVAEHPTREPADLPVEADGVQDGQTGHDNRQPAAQALRWADLAW